ncbi:MAG TPA: peptide ABC transporter substrate-binding protein, partial [Aggregatilineaceae bacterium]|nr:peptide ABC transporter substrate-binding protein [Aggregatilineaceae bacterium]
MNVKRCAHLVFGLLVIAFMLLPSAKFTSAQEPKVLRSAWLPGDVKLDPSLATDVNSIQVVNETYVGMTTLDENTSDTEPGIASEWTVSDDGLTYTFKLLDNIPWVRYDPDKGEVVQVTDDSGNVRMVTAQDVVYGITRTLDPATASEYAGSVLQFWVKGGQEKLAGQDVPLGVLAVDDHTVQITSPRPAGFLASIYGMWMARPEPQWAIEEYGDAWTEAGNYESYGPYALEDWEHDVQLTLIKNPFWPGIPGVPQAKIDEHTFVYLDLPAMLAAYEAGELDWLATVPAADLDRLRVQYPDELKTVPDICTYYYGFNVLKPPVDNVHMRLALSMAIDRDTIVKITNGGEKPAGFFSLPALAAAPHQEDYPDLAIHSDPEGAKAELQAYFDETGTTLADLPPITLQHNTSQLHATIAQAVQQMWKETLGIEVQITSQDFATHQETLRRDAPQVWRIAWCYDYPDTQNFLYDVFYSVGPDSNNHTNWENPEFRALLDEAVVLTDNNARRELYAKADSILVKQDAAIAPIYYYMSNQ